MFLPVDPEKFNDSILTVLKCDGVMEFNDDETAAAVASEIEAAVVVSDRVV